MSVANEIERIANAKEEIRTAILNKGIKMDEGESIDKFATYINKYNGGSSYEKYPIKAFTPDHFTVPSLKAKILTRIIGVITTDDV